MKTGKSYPLQLLSLPLWLLFLWSSTLYSQPYSQIIAQYRIDAAIDVDAAILKAQLSLQMLEDTQLSLDNLQSVRVNGKDIHGKVLAVRQGKSYQISYEYPLQPSEISTTGDIFLHRHWYPHTDALALFELKLRLPAGYRANSEADQIIQKGHFFYFDFQHPLDNLSLIASKDYIVKTRQYQHIQIETWFKPQNSHFSQTYLQKAQQYLELYQKLLGPFPYRRFAIIDSPLPVGYSLPTYTVLSQHIIARPFVLEQSLAHEILHQWLGNHVYIDASSGNWAEGLTTYLADHYLSKKRDQDIAYRKNILQQNTLYGYPQAQFAVNHFLSRYDKTSKAIGYGRAAMIFHQLYRYSLARDKSTQIFYQAIARFIQENRYRKASWHDIQKVFEEFLGYSLYEDFHHWLTRKDLPRIKITKEAELVVDSGKILLNFELQQQTASKQPFHLHLPVQIQYLKQVEQKQLHLTKMRQSFSIELKQLPQSVVIDANYDLIRALDEEELQPTLDFLATTKPLLAVVGSQEHEQWLALLKSINPSVQILSPEKFRLNMLEQQSLIIVGKQEKILQHIFANAPYPSQGMLIDISSNPFNQKYLIARIQLAETEDIANYHKLKYRLKHYGQYSRLWWQREDKETGRVLLQQKLKKTTTNGLVLYQRNSDYALQVAKPLNLHDIVARHQNRQIFMIGEKHDNYAHHLNQLQLIQLLHQDRESLVIAMEMFQKPFQKVLDDYIQQKIDEKTFLRQSQYFDNWRFDYNLYKPIIDYARDNKLPLLALNVTPDITRTVSRKGFQALGSKQQKQVPQQLDLTNWQYRQDLRQIFEQHPGERKFANFLASQAIWDEAMAETAVNYLRQHPQATMVILAGNGHLRYRYGIADRIERRLGIRPLVIVQDEQVSTDIADYILFPEPVAGAETPKIGVYLDSENKDRLEVTKVIKNSVAQKSGLQEGDIIISLDAQPIKDFTDLKLALMSIASKSEATMEISRNGKKITKTLVLQTEKKQHKFHH